MKYLFILLVLLPFISNAQYKPKEYLSFDGKKELVFYDNFDDDRNGWLIVDEEDSKDTSYVREDSISSGLLHIKSTGLRKKQYLARETGTNIDFNRNFDLVLDAKISAVNRKTDAGILYWARAKSDSITGYQLYFWDNGYFCALYTDINAKGFVPRGGEKHRYAMSVYNRHDFNRYTIRHYNHEYYFFINGVFKCTLPSLPVKGGIVGLGASTTGTAFFDHIGVFYLP